MGTLKRQSQERPGDYLLSGCGLIATSVNQSTTLLLLSRFRLVVVWVVSVNLTARRIDVSTGDSDGEGELIQCIWKLWVLISENQYCPALLLESESRLRSLIRTRTRQCDQEFRQS